MHALPPFAERLGLAPDADEKAVKRAYAREVKRIDQEREPARFQSLREDYEAALAWIRNGGLLAPDADDDPDLERDLRDFFAEADAAPADAQGPASAPDEPLLPPREERERSRPGGRPDARAGQAGEAPASLLAQTVFDEFQRAYGKKGLDRESIAGLMDRSLADTRLEPIDAREWFEKNVLSFLQAGWRPGNQYLYAVASKKFGWKDQARLRKLGGAGIFMDEALREAAIFNQQNEATRVSLIEAIEALRLTPQPPLEKLWGHFPSAHRLAQVFPHLMTVLTSVPHYEAWKVFEANRPEPQPARHWYTSPMFWVFGIGFLMVGVFGYIGKGMQEEAARRWNAAASAPAVSQPRAPAQAKPTQTDRLRGAAILVAVGSVSREGCMRAAGIAHEHGDAGSGLGWTFDRYILRCIDADYWPGLPGSDPWIEAAKSRRPASRPPDPLRAH